MCELRGVGMGETDVNDKKGEFLVLELSHTSEGRFNATGKIPNILVNKKKYINK
jgi:hypothetical protein